MEDLVQLYRIILAVYPLSVSYIILFIIVITYLVLNVCYVHTRATSHRAVISDKYLLFALLSVSYINLFIVTIILLLFFVLFAMSVITAL